MGLDSKFKRRLVKDREKKIIKVVSDKNGKDFYCLPDSERIDILIECINIVKSKDSDLDSNRLSFHIDLILDNEANRIHKTPFFSDLDYHSKYMICSNVLQNLIESQII